MGADWRHDRHLGFLDREFGFGKWIWKLRVGSAHGYRNWSVRIDDDRIAYANRQHQCDRQFWYDRIVKYDGFAAVEHDGFAAEH